MTRILADVAHARAGDKGDTSILMIAAWIPSDIDVILRSVTPERVAAHFGSTAEKVTVRSIRDLGTVTIVLREQLRGGVTRATTLDPHGKSLSGHLLQLSLEDEAR